MRQGWHEGRPGGRRRVRPLLLALLAIAAAAAIAACGEDEEDGDQAAAEPSVVAIETTGSGREVGLSVPDSATGGLAEVELTNSADGPHGAQLLRIEGDHSEDEVLGELQQAMRGEAVADWFEASGGVPSTPPGETASVTQVLEPGTYYVVDDEARDPSVSIASFEVTEAGGDGELPAADATVTADDYSFEAENLTAGENAILFENAGEQWHHVVAAPIEPGNTIEDVEQAVMSEGQPEGPPPVDFSKEVATSVVAGGDSQVVDLDLVSGKYALLCFISDREGGPPHVAQGMIAEVEVE